MNKVENIIALFIRIIFTVMALYLFWISIVGTTVSYPVQVDDSLTNITVQRFYLPDTALTLLLTCLITAAIPLIYTKLHKSSIKTKQIKLEYIYLVYFAIGLFFALSTQYEPISDPGKVMKVAEQMLEGNFTEFSSHEGYMYRCPYQNGLVLIDAFLMIVFREKAFVAFQVLNLISCIVIIEMIGRIAALSFSNEKIGYYTRTLLLLFPGLFFYITYNYGTLPSMACITIAIDQVIRFEKDYRKRRIIFAACLTGLAYVLKMNALIILTAMVIFLFRDLLFRKGKKAYTAVMIFSLLLGLVVFRKGVDFITESITHIPTAEGMPMLNYILMTTSGDGTYNGTTVNVFREAGFDTQKSKEMAIAGLQQTYQYYRDNKGTFTHWLLHKIVLQWNDPSFESFTINTGRGDAVQFASFYYSLFYGGFRQVLTWLLNIAHSTILLGAVFMGMLYNKNNKEEFLHPALIAVGGFAFHIIWEAAAHYVVVYYWFLIPCAIAGYRAFAKSIIKLQTAVHMHRSVDKFALGKIICLIAATMCITLGSGTNFVRNHFSFADSAETISAYQESVEQNISSN